MVGSALSTDTAAEYQGRYAKTFCDQLKVPDTGFRNLSDNVWAHCVCTGLSLIM